MSFRSSVIRLGFTFVFLFVVLTSFNVGVVGKINYQFEQLDPFYQESLFGLRFDYNNDISPGQSLQLFDNILTGQEFGIETDPNPNIDNNITLVGHDSHGIKSAFLAVENIKRTEFIPLFGTVEWQASLPYFKYLSVYSLPSGESVILTQDLLGLTLNLDGHDFVDDQYLVGYANIPLDILEFLFDSINSVHMVKNSIHGYVPSNDIRSYSSTNPMEISIQENYNELVITATYSNISYLFQTNPINIEQISSFRISDKFLLIEFESLSFSTRILKYSTSTNTGVETQLEMNVGTIQNLVINEELPSEVIWQGASETHVEKEYSELIRVNDTFSWYKGDDINKRMSLFNQASLSFLVSHNLGVVEGSESKKSSTVSIDGRNTSREELIQSDIVATENITLTQNEDLLFINHIKGHDYALHQDPNTEKWSVIPTTIKSIALNQHPSLSGNILFLEEASLLNSLIADSVSRFVTNKSILSLNAEQLLKIATLYLTSTEYVQEFQIDSWNGYPTKIRSLSNAVLESKKINIGLSKISHFSFFPGFISLAILVVFLSRKRRT